MVAASPSPIRSGRVGTVDVVPDGILAGPIDLDGPTRPRHPVVPVLPGTAITHLSSGIAGTVERFENTYVRIRDKQGRSQRILVTEGGFEVDGVRCTPAVGRRDAAAAPTISASGSITVDHDARTARGSRILVEGVHDAELVEKIWGDDLRYEGVVVERLDGMDDLMYVVRSFGPRPGRRLGILLDHLVDGSKEQRAADAVDHPDVLVAGTPYVDVWQAVRPSVAGIDAWPEVPKGEPWKEGVLRRLGRADVAPGAFWRQLLGRVTTYADLEAPLVNAVERLIDFVTETP